MKDQLVSFETAKLAEEKGFPQYTDIEMAYALDGCFIDIDFGDHKFYEKKKESELIYNMSEYSDYVVAPTQSLLQKWLRDLYNIDIFSGRTYTNDHRKQYYFLYCTDEKCQNMGVFDSYEEGLEKCLIHILKSM